jgi:hypothetical protein
MALPDLTTQPHQNIIGAARQAATTLFQPGLMVGSILREDAIAESADEAETTADAKNSGGNEEHVRLPRTPGTRVVPPTPPPSTPLELDTEAYFLVLGAPPGAERLPLTTARTTFGRTGADVLLKDDAVSGPHFQIDVMGREFFVRDLKSRNGTLLNGHMVRYSEILPGDELQAGETVLVFRTADDGLSGRSS